MSMMCSHISVLSSIQVTTKNNQASNDVFRKEPNGDCDCLFFFFHRLINSEGTKTLLLKVWTKWTWWRWWCWWWLTNAHPFPSWEMTKMSGWKWKSVSMRVRRVRKRRRKRERNHWLWQWQLLLSLPFFFFFPPLSLPPSPHFFASSSSSSSSSSPSATAASPASAAAEKSTSIDGVEREQAVRGAPVEEEDGEMADKRI